MSIEYIKTAGCGNCGGNCVITAGVENGKVVTIVPDNGEDTPGKPQLRACLKGYDYIENYFGDERLKYPMKRVGQRGKGDFQRISWEEAEDIIASETKRIKNKYGASSRYVNYATGVCGAMFFGSIGKRLLALDGGYLGSYNSYSTACTAYATPYTYGTANTGNSPIDYINSKLIILWGHNPSETRFTPNTMHHLTMAKKAGAKIISVDPRYTDTAAAIADEWIALRPATDAALLSAMAYAIIKNDLHDKDFINKYCQGFNSSQMPEGLEDVESYEDYIFGKMDNTPKTPQWAAAITGVSVEVIEKLAIDYATIKPACLLQGYGPQRHSNGEQITRAATVLAAITGNVGIKGGCASGSGYVSNPSKVRYIPEEENPYKGAIPVFLWTDAIARGKEMTAEDGVVGVPQLDSNIKMILNLSSNTLINQHSDCNRTAELLSDTTKCEFIVCSDVFMTPSAKFADILLPSVSIFEMDNIVGVFGYENSVLKVNKLVEPIFECRDEYAWCAAVAKKLGIYDEFSDGKDTMSQWVEYLYERMKNAHPELPCYEEFCIKGIYQWENEEPIIAFKKQIEDFSNNPFPTKSGKIEIFSRDLYNMGKPEEIPAVPKFTAGFEGVMDPLIKMYPLQCIGWHSKRRCHSNHENSLLMEDVEPHMLWINPIDAAQRNIEDGENTAVFNARGKILIKCHVTNRIAPGVVALPQGAWYTTNDKGEDVRGCINTLTTWRPTPLAKGNPQHSNLVEVMRRVD